MRYKALKSFSGQISMSENEIREIVDKELIDDLLKAGYIEEIQKIGFKKARRKADED